jgi:hypothetical protein
VLLVEGLGRTPDGPQALRASNELLGLPVIEQGSSFNLSNLHPLNVSAASVEVLKEASYYQDVGHQLAVTQMRQRSVENIGVGVSLEGPPTDFATLAKSFGIYGEGPILSPEEVRPALERGLKVVKENRTPALIDTVTQPR